MSDITDNRCTATSVDADGYVWTCLHDAVEGHEHLFAYEVSARVAEKPRLGCKGSRHVFTGPLLDAPPWCDCGNVRNGFYEQHRTWLDKLLGLPKKPQ